MKQAKLLSIAAAAVLTFGSLEASASAQTKQPNAQPFKPVTFQFMLPSTEQSNIQQFLTSIFGSRLSWHGFVIQPANHTVAPKQTTPVTKPAEPKQTAPTPKPAEPKQTAPTPKPAEPKQTAPAPKPAEPKQTAPAPKPAEPKQTAPAPKPAAPKQAASTISQYEQQVINATNAERAKHGLPALKLDTALNKVARAKSQDMYTNNYFSHTSPTYGSPFDMMKAFNIPYRAAGENIAMGQRTPQEVVTAWMNSTGHRANILNGTYTHIGVGYVAAKNVWTQMFISK